MLNNFDKFIFFFELLLLTLLLLIDDKFIVLILLMAIFLHLILEILIYLINAISDSFLTEKNLLKYKYSEDKLLDSHIKFQI